MRLYQIRLAETFGSRAASTVALDPQLAKSKSTPSAPTVSSTEAQTKRKESRSHFFLVDFLLFPLKVCTSYTHLGFEFGWYLLWAPGNTLYPLETDLDQVRPVEVLSSISND